MDPVVETAPRVLLIGGSGRCGTNVLKDVLARHPAAAALPFEHRLLVDPDGLLDFYCTWRASWTPYLADRRLRRLARLLKRLAHEPWPRRLFGALLRRLQPAGRLLAPPAYHRYRLADAFPNYLAHVEELLTRLRDFSFSAAWVGTPSGAVRPRLQHRGPGREEELAGILRAFLAGLYRDLLAARGASVFVEDNTWNILFAAELLALLPDARLVHIVRDPRDVVASFCRQRWCPDDPRQAARWYMDILARWEAQEARLPAARWTMLRLEDLTADPEATLRRVCELAGLPWEARLLEADLGGGHHGRWRTDLPADRRDEVCAMLRPALERFGYEGDSG